MFKSIVLIACATLASAKTISGMELEKDGYTENKTQSICEKRIDTITMSGVCIPLEENHILLKFFVADCHKELGPISNFKFVCKTWFDLMETDNMKNFVKSCKIILPSPTVEEINKMVDSFSKNKISEFTYHGLIFTLSCPTPPVKVRKFEYDSVAYYVRRIISLTYDYNNNTSLQLKEIYPFHNITFGSMSKEDEIKARSKCSYGSSMSGRKPTTYCILFDHTRGIYRLITVGEPLSNLFSNQSQG
jgi:hypothetical protein